MEQYIKHKLLISLCMLFMLPNLANSQEYEYVSNYNTNCKCNSKNIDFKIKDLLYKNGNLQISMSFHNLEKIDISLIKPDTSMIECSILYIYVYDDKNQKHAYSGNYQTISQLACLNVNSEEEILNIAPNETVLFTMTIPIDLENYNNPKIEMFLDYDYSIISKIELRNPIQQELRSNVLSITKFCPLP